MALREGSCNGYPDYRGYRQGYEQQPQKVRVVGGRVVLRETTRPCLTQRN